MKHILKIIMLLLLISSNQLFAGQKKADSLRFSGKLATTDDEKKDWIVNILYNTQDNFSHIGNVIQFKPKIDGVGNFHFSLPNLGKPYFFVLVVYQTTNVGLGKNKFFENGFFTEPGDDIKIDIILELNNAKTDAINTVMFTGVGAEKYNLAWKLQNSFFQDYLLEVRKLGLQKPLDSTMLKDKMQGLNSILQHYMYKKSNLLYSSSISPEIRQIFNYEYGAYNQGLNNEWLMRSQALYIKYPQYRKQIGAEYLKFNHIFYKKPDTIAKYCSSYIEELLKQKMFEQQIKTGQDALNIETIYSMIKTSYSGVVRERISGLLLTNPRIQRAFTPIENRRRDSLLKDGLSQAKLPYIKKAYEEKILELHHSSFKIINSEFLDLNGKKFELKSLAGKVILLDVWFNGCFGCADFHTQFEKVYPKFKNDKNFVVLSVNVDKDKDRWVKGIENGLYTAKDYIQVTTGSGFDHPFMKYYNIQGASYVMVIDQNGKILPKPAIVEGLSDQITAALSKMK